MFQNTHTDNNAKTRILQNKLYTMSQKNIPDIIDWVKWELERSSNGQLCQEYWYQNLLKSDNLY